MTISEMAKVAWETAEAKGFHAGRGATRDDTLIRLCLIHTEVSEAAQEVKRHWNGSGDAELIEKVGEELADILIRVGDLAKCIGVHLETAVCLKLNKNEARPAMYGTPKEGA